jgi:hypothetical protein
LDRSARLDESLAEDNMAAVLTSDDVDVDDGFLTDRIDIDGAEWAAPCLLHCVVLLTIVKL